MIEQAILTVSFGRTPAHKPIVLRRAAEAYVAELGLEVVDVDPPGGVRVGPKDVFVTFLVYDRQHLQVVRGQEGRTGPSGGAEKPEATPRPTQGAASHTGPENAPTRPAAGAR